MGRGHGAEDRDRAPRHRSAPHAHRTGRVATAVRVVRDGGGGHGHVRGQPGCRAARRRRGEPAGHGRLRGDRRCARRPVVPGRVLRARRRRGARARDAARRRVPGVLPCVDRQLLLDHRLGQCAEQLEPPAGRDRPGRRPAGGRGLNGPRNPQLARHHRPPVRCAPVPLVGHEGGARVRGADGCHRRARRRAPGRRRAARLPSNVPTRSVPGRPACNCARYW